MRVGVIGLGFGAVHARVLSELPGAQLAAVCDTDAERRNAVARRHAIDTYADYHEMLDDETIDAVVVAVPARSHVEVASAVIDAGKAVLVEKPLAPTCDEAKTLAKAAAAAGVPLMAGHIERFNPAVVELRKRVQAGEIGRVLHMTARRVGPIVVRTQDIDIVHDSALHDIDAMRYILGSEVERVYAESQQGVLMPFEDSVSGVLRFEAGAVGSIEVNWLSPLRQRDLTVLGERGLFALDYTAQTLTLHAAPDRDEATSRERSWSAAASAPSGQTIAIERCEPLAQELSAFVAAVRDGTPMPITADDALKSLAIADAVTESARSGQPVSVKHD